MSNAFLDCAGHYETAGAMPLQRVERAVLFVDVVEYGRLVEADELGTVTRWFALAEAIEHGILPAHGGKLVKELGDGLLIGFTDVPTAVAAALAIQALARDREAGIAPAQRMHLRMGLECALVITDRNDLHGVGVNLAARLSQLAGPGEIVVSAAVRDRLTPALDAEVEDLGPCYLKHRVEPVRAFRITPPGSCPHFAPGLAPADLEPTIAVLPFATEEGLPDHRVIGQVLADEVICHLSRSPELAVISGLSTRALARAALDLGAIRRHLAADYVLRGRYRVESGRVVLDAELAELPGAQIVWSERLVEPVAGLLRPDRATAARLVAGVAGAVMSRAVRRAQCQPLPTLESYTLLLGAVGLMHRLARHDFEQARAMLETLIERAPRQPVPCAWLAKWHVLKVQQGWSVDEMRDAAEALELTRRALDTNPHCTLALSVDGFVHTNLLKRLDVAKERYDLAIEVNPSDALAWLLRGTLHAFMGEGRKAVSETTRALCLSPLDPHRYFFDSLAATAHVADQSYERALQLAERSLIANRTHTSTLRVKAIAQWYLGRHEAARRTVRELLRLEPNFTIGGYINRSPATASDVGREAALALAGAGVPA